MGTDFLYARPRFFSGMGMVMDIAGVMVRRYNCSPTPDAADSSALRSDWATTGADITTAVGRIGREIDGKGSQGKAR